MRTIIAGTDFSKSSINACRYAAMLAQKLNCKLTLFNLFEAPIIHSNMGLYGYSYISLRRENEERTFKLVKVLQEEFPKLKINQFVTSGAFKNELQDFIKSHYIAAAVMGLESKHKFSKSIFGSSGTNLIGKINTPVIIVPESYKQHKLNKIALAVDSSEKLHKATLDDFGTIIKKMDVQLELIHVRTDAEFINPTITSLTINKKKLPILNIPAKDLQLGIKKYCVKNRPDMMATISKKHSVFYNFFIESDSKKIAFVTKAPVLVIHED